MAQDKTKVYAHGTLVLWTMHDLDLSRGAAILTDPSVKKVAIASPKAAPYGRQAVNAMKRQGIYQDVQSKLVYGENISQTSQFISTKAADIGFTAKSIVIADNMKDKGKWVEVPAADYDPIAQGVIVLKRGIDDTRKFYDFLFSDAAKGIFQKNGYTTP